MLMGRSLRLTCTNKLKNLILLKFIPNPYNLQLVHLIGNACVDVVSEELWPGIFGLEGPYDLCLMDPPFRYPTFFGSSIPYEALPLKDYV